MPFDFIIILSATAKDAESNYLDIQDGMYVGAAVRMAAAAKLIERYSETNFIVVGGYNEANKGIVATSKKVDDIVDNLKISAPGSKIQEVYSLPCTHHNFVAVFNYWKHNKVYPQRVGIFSNDYHLPRSLAFAENLSVVMLPDRDIIFEPLVAESFLEDTEIPLSDDTTRASYERRIRYEKVGLEELQNGEYVDFCLTKDFELLRTLIYENPDGLLTEQEKSTLHIG